MSQNRYGKSIILLLVMSLLSLGLVACGGTTGVPDDVAPEPDLEGEAPLDENANEANENGAEGNANEAPAGDASVVEVTEEEFVINMPASLPAGLTSFEVTNTGTTEHNFEVEGQGIEEEFEQNLQPGETMTLEVDLQPGTYEIYCPVPGHREQGMEVELTVTE